MTLSVRIIPCLDVTDGRVVKGVNFTNLVDAGDPVEMAALYGAEGADELTFLDISASIDGRETTLDVVRRTAEQVFIPLTVGGGIRNVADVDRLLRAGADKVSINTAVWMVMCREPMMRAPLSGLEAPNSERIAIRPGISFSAKRISLRPYSASEMSATL